MSEELIPSPAEFQPGHEQDRDPRAMRDIVQHFYKKLVSANAIAEYCNLKHYPVITPGELEDWTFAWEHEQRVVQVIPLICAELATWRYNRGLNTDEEMKAITKENDNVETRICEILEENGLIYQEIDLFSQMLGNSFAAILQRVGTRLNNLCLNIMVEDAKEKYGKTMPLNALAEEDRKRHNSKKTDD